jgi:catechol-2,3-dioxygenase
MPDHGSSVRGTTTVTRATATRAGLTSAADRPAVVAGPIQLRFAGVSHLAFTVTDLDASQRFYTEVLDFVVVMDVGYGRICMHPGRGLR